METEVRGELAKRAFLFDDPSAYLAGVDAALEAVERRDRDAQPAEDNPVADERHA